MPEFDPNLPNGRKPRLAGATLRKDKAQRHARAVARRAFQQRTKAKAKKRSGTHRPRQYLVENKLRVRKPTARKHYLSFPVHLNFTENADETLEFLASIRHAFFQDYSRHIQIDHKSCESISPEVALVLIAELTRGHEYSKRCSLFGNKPKHEAVESLLGAVGYLGHFDMPWKKSELETRHFLMHFTEHQTRAVIAKELVQHFAPAAHLDIVAVKALGRAIIECMDNVANHAYPSAGTVRCLQHQWWLLGYRDMSKGEISFCFYDQGVGIPNTIRTRWKDNLGVFSVSDVDLIVKGVLEGYSSTKDPTRGRGLPKLKLFIDNASNGELVIVSNKSQCTFNKGSGPTTRQRATELDGTLVVWRIEA